METISLFLIVIAIFLSGIAVGIYKGWNMAKESDVVFLSLFTTRIANKYDLDIDDTELNRLLEETFNRYKELSTKK